VRLAIPFYCHPDANAREWQLLAEHAARVEFAVANVANGPGMRVHPAYMRAIDGVSGLRWVGYVPVDYGRRPSRDVLDDVRRWRDGYGVTAVMLDEVPADRSSAAATLALVARVRAAGADLVVGNAGRPVAPVVAAAFDVVCSRELGWEDYRLLHSGPRSQQAGRPPRGRPSSRSRSPRRWHLIHSCPPEQLGEALRLAGAQGADLVWATTGTLDNPWVHVPAESFVAVGP